MSSARRVASAPEGSPEPARVYVERDGLRIGALDWGGEGPPLVMLHAGGLCAGVFEPLAHALRGTFRSIAVDLRGHGASDAPATDEGFSYVQMAGDVEAILTELGIERAMAFGHSLGGCVAAMAAVEHGHRWSRVVICESGLCDPERLDQRVDSINALASAVRRRRSVWTSAKEFHELQGAKPPFKEFGTATREAFVRWGTVERSDGGIELACSPEVESRIYELSQTELGVRGLWSRLSELVDHPTEVVLMDGDTRSSLSEAMRESLRAISAGVVEASGGHYFPLADRERMAELLREALLEPLRGGKGDEGARR